MKERKIIDSQELTAWIPKLAAQGRIIEFYKCKPWLHLRAEVLEEQNYECQICKAAGRYTAATAVHHIKTVRRFPWLALTKNNLLAVCDDCHYKIHHPQKHLNEEKW